MTYLLMRGKLLLATNLIKKTSTGQDSSVDIYVLSLIFDDVVASQRSDSGSSGLLAWSLLLWQRKLQV